MYEVRWRVTHRWCLQGNAIVREVTADTPLNKTNPAAWRRCGYVKAEFAVNGFREFFGARKNLQIFGAFKGTSGPKHRVQYGDRFGLQRLIRTPLFHPLQLPKLVAAESQQAGQLGDRQHAVMPEQQLVLHDNVSRLSLGRVYDARKALGCFVAGIFGETQFVFAGQIGRIDVSVKQLGRAGLGNRFSVLGGFRK
jgi:hypothetical protein